MQAETYFVRNLEMRGHLHDHFMAIILAFQTKPIGGKLSTRSRSLADPESSATIIAVNM